MQNPPHTIFLTGPWTVGFPKDSGAAAPHAWASLASWSENTDAAVKYFSGTANYTVEFVLPADALQRSQRVRLDLGRVEKFAGITLNGRPLRVLWHAPYALDVTDAVQPGRNRLEVAVTNLLVNRLIGDQQRPASERRTWSTHQPYTKDSPLLPSGLLGPVTLTHLPILPSAQ